MPVSKEKNKKIAIASITRENPKEIYLQSFSVFSIEIESEDGRRKGTMLPERQKTKIRHRNGIEIKLCISSFSVGTISISNSSDFTTKSLLRAQGTSLKGIPIILGILRVNDLFDTSFTYFYVHKFKFENSSVQSF